MKVEHLSILQVALQVVVYLHGTTTRRATRIEQIARLQRKVLTDVGDNLIYLVEHIARTAFLHRLAIDVQMEVDSLYVSKLLDVHPFTDGSRAIESLGKLPWLPFLPELLLHLTSRKVDTHSYGIIIAMGETLWYGLAQLADAHHQLRLILNASQMVWDKERLAIVELGRISLGKDDRTLWFR